MTTKAKKSENLIMGEAPGATINLKWDDISGYYTRLIDMAGHALVETPGYQAA